MPHYRSIPPVPIPPPTPAVVVPPLQPVGVHGWPVFAKGTFAQPTYNMPGAKILGFNCLVSIPLNHPPLDWAVRATALGFYQIRPPVGVKALDADNPLWIAWENPDEPDRVATPQAVIDDNYAKAKAIGIPTFTNFDGSRLLGIPNQTPTFGAGASYASILAKTDIACTDVHPVAGWGATAATPNGAINLWAPGYASDTLREMKGDNDNLRMMMYLETTQETQQFRGPTVAEMQIGMRQIERRKMRGYIAFTFNFTGIPWGTPSGTPNAFNGMDAEHREAIATFNDTH